MAPRAACRRAPTLEFASAPDRIDFRLAALAPALTFAVERAGRPAR